MIYIIKHTCPYSQDSSISSIYYHDKEDLHENYLKQMEEHAFAEFRLVINPHYPTIVMNYTKFHSHNLVEEEYKAKCKQWKRYCMKHTFEHYLQDQKAVKQKYKATYL